MKKILLLVLLTFTIGANAQEFIATLQKTALTKGWIKVYREGYIGYVDETGIEIIPPVYNEIGTFGDYCGNAAVMKRDSYYGIIDADGNLIAEAQYEMIGPQDDYNPGWILVKKDGLYGFIDCSGTEIVPPSYTEIGTDAIRLKSEKIKLN